MTKKATVITYGCQMNVNESAKIKKILENLGYELTDNIEETDIAFLNTCTVREGAATQIYGKLGEIKRVREERGTKIVVTGCFAQEQGRELIKKFNYIDIVMGNQNIGRIPEAIEEIETYCIVPYVRGRERSVPMAELIEEARELVKKGYKEIILLGQNVNSYGKGLSENETFANLLQNICDIDGDFIIRFVSPHPRDFTDDVIDVIARNPKIARSLHLPLQSGSTRVLKLMNRGYSKEQYIALAEKIKERIPGVSLTADIIVGFPQETEEDFMDTLDVVDKVGFETSFMFMYSIRKGTKAAVMEGQIDDEVKKDRLHRLMSLQNSISKKLSMEYEGKTERVLVEGPSKKNKDMLSSRTSTNKIVLFKGDPSLEGQFVNVKIKECKTWTLYGELAEK